MPRFQEILGTTACPQAFLSLLQQQQSAAANACSYQLSQSLEYVYLDSEDALPQQHVSDGSVDVIPGGVSRGHHVAVLELHGLGTLRPELAGHDDLAPLGSALHDEPQHTIAGSARE